MKCSTGGDLKTGYMEKRIGENSNRQSLPESWKWQKRYWVLSEPKGLLYYFKSPDDPPSYRGIINIRECRIQDVDVNGMPKASSRSKYDLDGGGGTVSLLIKVSHKVPTSLSEETNLRPWQLRCEDAEVSRSVGASTYKFGKKQNNLIRVVISSAGKRTKLAPR
jgi:hypothetical protein